VQGREENLKSLSSSAISFQRCNHWVPVFPTVEPPAEQTPEMALESFNRFISSFGARSSARGLIMGLDAAGKTSVLYRLKLGELVQTIPTIGFNVVSQCSCFKLNAATHE
jgi:hypothetical protein